MSNRLHKKRRETPMASLKLNPFPPFTNCCIVSNTYQTFPKNYLLPSLKTPLNPNISIKSCRAYSSKPPKASQLQQLVQEESNTKDEFEKSVKVLKDAAKTRKVPKEEVLAALSVMKKAKVDTSEFLSTLGGTESPGRTWMLIFTTKDRLKTGTYFPITAVQRFDAAAKRIENGVFFGPLGNLTFEGKFSWKTRMLAFTFECLNIKVGPFDTLQISLPKGGSEETEPSTKKDPFFIWFYIDEEIAVAQGRGGGTAFWCRCRRVTT